MKYRMFKIIFIITLALTVITGFVIPMAVSQNVPPTTVAGTITVNNVATDGVSVSGGGGSDTTHDGGKYTLDVTPDVPITITVTYNGHSASGSLVVKSGDMATKSLNINIPTSTPTPGPTQTPTQAPTSHPTSTPYNPPGPVVTAKPPPDPTYYPTQPAMLTSTPKPTINTSVKQGTNSTPKVSTSPDSASVQSNDLSKVNDTSSGNSNVTAVPTMVKTRSPGFDVILLLAAYLGVAYLFAIRSDDPRKDKKK